MGKSELIINVDAILRDRFRFIAKVFEVEKSPKHPQGIKAKFVLIDTFQSAPVLLVDNHEPFGFHAHTELPGNKDKREKLETTDYLEAYDFFKKQAKKVMDETN